MKRLLFILLILPFFVQSQKEFHNWYFGSTSALSFTGGGIPIFMNNSVLDASEGSASISDCNGNLLFYTNGSTVYNSNHQVMSNGTGLFGEAFATQNSLIVKRPGSKDIYYLFTASTNNGFRYSTINMKSSGGLGSVIQKNVNLNPGATQKIAATYHANGDDIWVVTHYTNSDVYESFLVTKTGVNLTGVKSASGPIFDDGHGELKMNQQGTVIGAVVQFNNGSAIGGGGLTSFADYDNATGIVSNGVGTAKYGQPHGIDFSADGSKAYITSWSSGVFQFDMTGLNFASILTAGIKVSTGSDPAGSLLLGPDGIIYVADDGSSYLHAILSPSATGVFCNYQRNYVYLGGKSSGWELPNVVLPSNIDQSPNSVNFQDLCLNEATSFSLGRTDDIVEVRWDFGDVNSGITNYATGLTSSHVFSAVGTFNVTTTITYTCGEEIINTQVIITEGPNIDFNNVSGCPGSPISIGGASEANVSYSWSPTTGLNNPLISNPDLTLQKSSLTEGVNTLQYTVTAINSQSGCEDQNTINVLISNPEAEAGPDVETCSNDAIEIGSDTVFSVLYNWYPSINVDKVGSSYTNFIGVNSSKVDQLFTMGVSANLNGCLDSDSVVITIKPLPWLENPTDSVICSNDSVQLNVGGNTSTFYSWSPSFGLSNASATSPFVNILNKTNATQNYEYIVQMHLNACMDTDTVSINVLPLAYANPNAYACPGANTQLETFGPGTAFVWTPNLNIDNVNAANPIVTPVVSTTYYVTINDSNGCVNSDSVEVLVDPRVPVEAGNDTTICRGDTLEIGTALSPTGTTFSWTPNKWVSNANNEVTNAIPDSTISYILFVQNDTCTNRDTINITVNQLPNIQVGPSTDICFKDSIWLVATGGLNYQWLDSNDILVSNDSAFVYPTDTTSFIVIGTDTNSCTNNDSAIVNVLPLPQIALSPDSSICFGDSIRLTASGGASYVWSPSSLVDDNSLANPMAYPNSNTTFYVNVTGANGCDDSDSVRVVVNSLPVIGLTGNGDTTICEGSSAKLLATGGQSYFWSPATNLSAVNVPNPTTNTSVPVTYQVVVTDSNNCIDSSNLSVAINEVPDAGQSNSVIAECAGFTVSFVDSSKQTDSWNWNFGDGTSSTEENPVHTFAFGSKGTSYLIAGNNNICFDTLSIPFDFQKIENAVNVTSYNVITPNGDGLNDCLNIDIDGDFINCTTVEIFNRWGLKVFSTNNYKICFDGINSTNNQPLKEGVYFYVISINDYQKNGFFHLVK